ncbi:MAG: shikimate kinase [Ferruginibacter sp.]
MQLFIIGFMGSGKTYWGKLWAQQTGMRFYDLDEVIEQQEGTTIAHLFETNGEAWFRKKETAVLHSFAGKDNCIIACGGGTPCFNNNMQWMNANGSTVYLDATTAQIVERLQTETDKRPLVIGLQSAELYNFVEQKLKERNPFYIQAKNILPVAAITADTITELLQTYTHE